MRLQQTTLAWAFSLAMFALLAGCGRSHVVRESARGNRIPAGEHPIKVSEPKYGANVVVQRGQNVYRIATENGLTALDLAIWNDIGSPYTIYPGQRLRLYPGSQSGVAVKPGTPAPRSTTSSASSRPASSSVVVPSASNVAWRWPADGAVVDTFASGDPTRQGVDIAGKSGQPVRAASDGVVVYSGSGLVGYGELVIVKHNDQWLSAYGHNRARLVNEGQMVKAGQQIAEMGRSGAARDMLHFEIRYNGKPVDPQQYLPKR
ncbi:peptidoglycan DD-metalloendopeptidase family protein [Thermomonas sp.]|uniref:peptidoglycan DD-metalloendopeptidase family protein n=1 Tax=Thermomonas sp. TaxID=1971895 RepID=UPI0024899A77|nr:peptidoglycan DD-metalloendopeptidase family protein [Thermomonas sp.]MDI1253900.1 peptidoglycan DD-metalloendopeptidase family protein [Thermomonas sp.]